MNSLRNYFSPTKSKNPSPSKPISVTPAPNQEVKSTAKSSAKVDKQQIITNMESVINSVKKKHRQRKKKEDKNKSEPEITDISNTLTNSLCFVSPDTTLDARKSPDSALKENIAENGNDSTKEKKRRTRSKKTTAGKNMKSTPSSSSLSQKSTPIEQNDVLKSPLKNGLVKDQLVAKSNKDEARSTAETESEKSTPKLNAFAMMMNARNRVIGSNAQGKDCPNEEAASPDPKKAKRKLKLQEWADKKGGNKRKLEEVEREEYIEQQMEKRAKRLKKMLVAKQSTPKAVKNRKATAEVVDAQSARNDSKIREANGEVEEVVLLEVPTPEIVKRKRGRPRKNAKPPDNPSSTPDIQTLKTRTPNSSKRNNSLKQQKKRNRRISSTESEKIVEICQDPDFLDSLSSPLPELGEEQTKPNCSSGNGTMDETKSVSVPKPPTSTQRKRSFRISSVESEEIAVNSQDSAFLENLSSPIKKRDSLLGYFSKLVSPNDNEAAKSESPDSTAGTTARPRRSCVGKIRYDEEIYETSPPKSESNRSRRQKSTVEEQKNKSSDVICLDISTDSTTKPTKLAPVFIKNVPKPTIDPAVLQAKKDFLMSGIPEKMANEIAKQKQFEEVYEISLETLFPKVSHVGCDDVEDGCRTVKWESCGIKWHENAYSPERRSTKSVENMNPLTPLKSPLPELKKLKKLENKIEIVKDLKAVYDKFPTYRCYKQLREKFKLRKAIAVEQVADSFVVLNMRQKTSNSEGEDLGDTNGELMFTEKYKPMNSDQVLVNFNPVMQLKEFLSTWQNGRAASKLNDSFSDFDCSNDSNNMEIGNCVVLHGPSSSGKTNAVFALANEMNFNVLEVNAGMKRNGKKLLQELQEATQSHQVRNDKSSLLKRSFMRKNSQDPNGNDSSSQSDLSGSAKLSLILFEDADIVFEQDSGFIEAIHQLVATSKRPVIIVSNSSECQHLGRLKRQSSAIEFPVPNVLNISKFLSVLSLVENCPIELDDIIALYLLNKRNLRRTLLELQFFIQSGGDRVRTNSGVKVLDFKSTEGKNDRLENKSGGSDIYTHQSLFEFYTSNQNANYLVPFPVDFDCLHSNLQGIFTRFVKNAPKSDSKLKSSKANDTEPFALDSLVQFYENISMASYLTSHEIEDRLSENLGETIAHTLTEKTIKVKLDSNSKIDLVPRSKPERSILSAYLPFNTVRTNLSIDLDYEPVLRSMCRSERSRSLTERRGSRFYHYLRNICANASSFSMPEFDGTCSIFDNGTRGVIDLDNGVES